MKLLRRTIAVSMLFGTTVFTTSSAMAYDFNGTYGGVQIGYGFGDTEQAFGSGPGFGAPFIVSPAQEADFDGVVGGVHVGHNWLGATGWVFGLEGDFELSGMSGDDNGIGGDINGLEGNWQGSLRGRVGTLISPTSLLYATAGVAILDADMVKDNPPVDSDTVSFVGWTAGAGWEFSLADNMSGRVEYRYTDFGSDDGRVSFYGVEASPVSHTIRLGVSWKL